MTTQMSNKVGWILDELLRTPHTLRALLLSADGLRAAWSEGFDLDLADRMAAAVSGLQSVSSQTAPQTATTFTYTAMPSRSTRDYAAGCTKLAVRTGFEAMVRDHRALLGEALDVLGFFRQVGNRDEQREIGVLVAGVLEHPVQGPLHLLPDGVSVGPDDHAAAHRAVVGQLGPGDQLVVPGREVLGTGGESLTLCHVRSFLCGQRSAVNGQRDRPRPPAS